MSENCVVLVARATAAKATTSTAVTTAAEAAAATTAAEAAATILTRLGFVNGQAAAMKGVMGLVNDEEMAAIADWLSSLTP